MELQKRKKNWLFILIVVLLLFTVFFSTVFKLTYALDTQILEESIAKVSVKVGDSIVYYNDFSTAIANINDNEEAILTLLTDIELTSTIKIDTSKKVIIDGNSMYSFVRGKTSMDTWYVGTLFNVVAGGELTLKNITIDGLNNWVLDQEIYDDALYNVKKISDISVFLTPEENSPIATAWLFQNSGTIHVVNSTIKNHYFKGGGIFYGSNASTTYLDGSIVTHCASTDGGIITYVTGTDTNFFMESGSIVDGNHGGGNGGLFKTYYNATVTINGGEIKNNTALNSNGTVSMTYGSTSKFILNDGLIKNNSGLYGNNNGRNAPIYIHSGSQFIMNGGIIEENRGNSGGAIDAPGYTTSDLELNGGIIRNNETSKGYEYRSALGISTDYDLVIGEDMVITGNVYIVGDLTNNGVINGNVMLDMIKSTDLIGLSGTGQINGTVYIKHNDDIIPTISEDLKITGDVIFYNSSQVLVTYQFNDGVDSDGKKQKIIPIESGTIPTSPEVKKEGYTFTGWYVDAELTTAWVPVETTSSITLYAGWTINSYMVTWNIDGVEVTEEVAYNEIIQMPESPTKDGHVFMGWKNYQEKMAMPAQDVVFEALWKINQYTITFVTNGGTKVAAITENYGTIVNEPEAPTYQYYNFEGWYFDETLSTPYYFDEPLTESITLYAGWSLKKYLATWDVDGVITTKEFSYGSFIPMPEEPTKKEHVFMGWKNYQENMTMPAEDITFIATWKINQYTINFETNGGSEISNITADYGTIVNQPANPTLKCHRFLGWYRDQELTVLYNFEKPLTESITLYAKWEEYHNWSEWQWYSDTEHIRTCLDNAEHKETGKHSGGTPTYDHKATCDICKKEYGDYLERPIIKPELPKEEPEVIFYKFISGKNNTYLKNNQSDLKFETNNMTDFVGIKINEDFILEENYTIEKNVILLKNTYLNLLSEGTYQLTVIYANDSITCDFVIESKKEEKPIEKEEKSFGSMLFWLILGLIIFNCFLGIIMSFKTYMKCKTE